MSVTTIPGNTRCLLWGLAGGRCQYDGCAQALFRDSLTKIRQNNAYIAHIVADSPDGPRGDKVRSEQLKAAISNLMLLCASHHRLVDHEGLKDHPEDRLVRMKLAHEARMALATAATPDRQSHVLLYGANIGEHASPLSFSEARAAMFPEWFPAEDRAIELGLKNSLSEDRTASFWQAEAEQLRGQFERQVASRLLLGQLKHLSIFAMAPQPLLVLLGTLLSDIPACEVYQRRREPTPDWRWSESAATDQAPCVVRPSTRSSRSASVALALSLSASIDEARIKAVLGDDVAVWHVTVPKPHNDFMRARAQLQALRETLRPLLDEIKDARATSSEPIHVFPVAPVSAAVELGRVLQPKAHPMLRLYDQNIKNGGFTRALDVGHRAQELSS